MKKFFNNRKKISVLLSFLIILVFGQAILIAKLYSEKDDKNYSVNLVKINTEKDSIDYLKMKNDLRLVDHTVQDLNNFLLSKDIVDERLHMLDQDSISDAVYLAKQTNRYSQYLVDLEKKLQQVPLGIPTDGYISSNFGKRKNPIPFPTIMLASAKPLKSETKKDSLSSNTSKKKENNIPAEKDQIQFHKGLDIAVAYGSDVRAAAAGKVIFSGTKGGYGNCVIVSHGNGLATLYGHLSQLLVKANETIKVGQVIAKSGNSGRSTGPHLHYEVHKNNTPVNPKLFMDI